MMSKRSNERLKSIRDASYLLPASDGRKFRASLDKFVQDQGSDEMIVVVDQLGFLGALNQLQKYAFSQIGKNPIWEIWHEALGKAHAEIQKNPMDPTKHVDGGK